IQVSDPTTNCTDSNYDNNSLSGVISMSGTLNADMEVAQTNDAPATGVQPGDKISLTITVTNHGPDTVNGVRIVDKLPFTLELASQSHISGEDYDWGSGEWYFGRLAPNESTSLTLDLNVLPDIDPAGVTNTVFFPTSQLSDPNWDNNQSSVKIKAAPGL